MVQQKKKQLSREDWIRCAFELLQEQGIGGVKIVVLAKRLNVTGGSFYWHFKGLRDLLDSVLEYWEREMTDAIVVSAQNFSGSAEARILNVMLQVFEHDAAIYDHPIAVWARNDPLAQKMYDRTIEKRLDYTRWMFGEIGFSEAEAAIRGRLMVTYLMGESSTNLKLNRKWKNTIQDAFQVLTRR